MIKMKMNTIFLSLNKLQETVGISLILLLSTIIILIFSVVCTH